MVNKRVFKNCNAGFLIFHPYFLYYLYSYVDFKKLCVPLYFLYLSYLLYLPTLLHLLYISSTCSTYQCLLLPCFFWNQDESLVHAPAWYTPPPDMHTLKPTCTPDLHFRPCFQPPQRLAPPKACLGAHPNMVSRGVCAQHIARGDAFRLHEARGERLGSYRCTKCNSLQSRIYRAKGAIELPSKEAKEGVLPEAQ